MPKLGESHEWGLQEAGQERSAQGVPQSSDHRSWCGGGGVLNKHPTGSAAGGSLCPPHSHPPGPQKNEAHSDTPPPTSLPPLRPGLAALPCPRAASPGGRRLCPLRPPPKAEWRVTASHSRKQDLPGPRQIQAPDPRSPPPPPPDPAESHTRTHTGQKQLPADTYPLD